MASRTRCWTLNSSSCQAKPDGACQMMMHAQNVLEQNDNSDVNKSLEHMASTQVFLEVKLWDHWLKYKP